MLTNVTGRGPGKGEQDAQALQAAAAAVRASGVLGRSKLLAALFDYLAAYALEARAPKESQIAHEVFGRPAAFVAQQDAIVRVYAHRLRAKLDQFARRSDQPVRLVLNPGQYRLVLESDDAAQQAQPSQRPRMRPGRWAILPILAALTTLLSADVIVGQTSALSQVLNSPFWRPFANSRRPLILVIGDYYIMGQSDDGYEVSRLVREFGINSKADLDAYLVRHPDKIDRYQDLGLSYLPTSSATAINELSALWAPRKRMRVVTMSHLTPELLRTSDIIFVGYMSSLGFLRDLVLRDSRYRFGETYDDMIDSRTGRRYQSQAALGPARGDLYEDYGYVGRFRGPSGNTLAIVAGLRDLGALVAAEQVSSAEALRRLAPDARQGDLEALYRARGQADVGYEAVLVTSSVRRRR